MAIDIHETAVVDPGAELADGVRVGPFAVIGAGVVIGEGSEIGAGAHIEGPTRMGRENRVFPKATLGFEPQDLKYRGEDTALEIGDRNQFREFVTVHRGTGHGRSLTTIGSDCLFMVYTHVAHDCIVGDRVVMANCATLAGHVEVESDATISAFSAVHQFCRVGCHAYIGGYSVITMDALPYVKTVGGKPATYGLNSIGLKRKGFDADAIGRLEQALKIFLASKLNTTQALERLRGELGGHPEVDHLVAFVESAQRGVIKALPGRRGGRGGDARG
ncbi:MAG: acyl-ACP--UDP-N-acetylglucosamine O-acyltransferase [Acidobacteria bacterium]|nr:acyl-ACP--UDP-N-acetylglucosamine O-acyltransferase [Acidobacteriota bacterium]